MAKLYIVFSTVSTFCTVVHVHTVGVSTILHLRFAMFLCLWIHIYVLFAVTYHLSYYKIFENNTKVKPSVQYYDIAFVLLCNQAWNSFYLTFILVIVEFWIQVIRQLLSSCRFFMIYFSSELSLKVLQYQTYVMKMFNTAVSFSMFFHFLRA